ncbi:unnamed protein product [Caenorhabditis angaria]|uniref:Uncharacterized protein n=1 Tax=Caenorhabditis angaria TaxID=860376 RepID=A0A9P1ITJ8_9PELO|nr:unnamed protein product [Caenorhabditis angaria]
MRHDELHIILLILLISNPTPVRTSIDFTVEEENSSKHQHHHHRHLHKLRDSRNIHHHPYISASSSIINPKNPGRLEQFSLNCPHVADASNKDDKPYNFVLNKKAEPKKMVLAGGRSKNHKEQDFGAEKRGDRSLGRESGQAAFSRLSDDRVYITRKEDETAQKSIIFARNDTPLKKTAQNSRFDAQIDYEIDMEDGLSWPNFREENLGKNRARSAQFYQNFANSRISWGFLSIFLGFLLIFV